MEKKSYKEIWDAYSKSWSEMDHSKRLQMFKQCLNSDCVYTDPLTQTVGYESLTGYYVGVSEKHPRREICDNRLPGTSYPEPGTLGHG